MARTPRIKIGDQDTFYHVTARVVGTPDWFPFADSAARNKLLSLIRKYTRASLLSSLASFEPDELKALCTTGLLVGDGGKKGVVLEPEVGRSLI